MGSTGEGSQRVGDKGAARTSILPSPTTATDSVASDANPSMPNPAVPLQAAGLPQIAGLTAKNVEAVKRAHELAAKMGFWQDTEFTTLYNAFPGQMPSDVSIQPKPSKVPVLRLDALGREIDEEGKVVEVPKAQNLSTLKVLDSYHINNYCFVLVFYFSKQKWYITRYLYLVSFIISILFCYSTH